MLTSFFSPQSVLIVGASHTPGKIGNDLVQNILGKFAGKIYGVNPKGGKYENTAHDILELYAQISDLPQTPDIAVIAIPARFVEISLQECGEKGIKNVIIISAGFKESGNSEGEENIQKIAQHYGMRILGPNCLGMMNTKNNLNVSFAEKIPQKGNIALVSQSGAMATALMDFAASSSLGFSKIISMGNKSDLNESDFLEFLEHDDETQVIVLYIEDIVYGRLFFEHCRRITKTKPIIVVKSGVSQKGALAAASHTGALSGEKEILETAFRQSGVTFTHSLEDLFLWSEFFSRIERNDLKDEMIIVTNAGGPGVMAIDNAEKYGIPLAEFSEAEKATLMQNLPLAASVNNPVDILGDATSEQYRIVLENIASLEKKRNVLVMLTHQTVTDTENIAKEIIAFQKKFPQILVMVSFMGGVSVEKGRQILESCQQKNFLHFDYPKSGLKALSQFQKWKALTTKHTLSTQEKKNTHTHDRDISEKSLEIIREKIKTIQKQYIPLLPQDIIAEMFELFEVSFIAEILVKTSAEAVQIFEKQGGDFVMKVASSDIAHKTDCGGVVLGVNTAESVEQAFSDIVSQSQNAYPNANIQGVTMQKMIDSSREVFIGMTRDDTFGEVVLFGLGGIFVNIFEDIARRLSPVSPAEIKEMIAEVKSYPLLKGARGEQSIDFKALEDMIMKISHIFHLIPEIQEIDINPAFVRSDGAWVVDAKFFI